MNRERDFDQTLRHWLDDGADQAPERFVWAALEDVERTAQRGAWLASLEGFIMKLKPAAPILGVAAVVLLAIAGYSLFGGNVGGPPTPIARTFTEADLPTIVPTEANPLDGCWTRYSSASDSCGRLIVDATTTGTEARDTPFRPGGPVMPATGFIDALMTNLNSTEAGGFVAWSALYETEAQAEAAFDALVNEHESPLVGWGLVPSTTAPGLGDESVLYDGAAYAFDDARIYLWRANNLLLAAVAVDVAAVDPDMAAAVDHIADVMDQRAR
jgi:hypothetical protein